jgi:hypothetical protein
MENITAFLTQSGETLLLLIVVLFIVVLTMLHHVQASRGRIVPRRPLAGFDIMRRALARGAETGQAIHVSPVAGTVGNRATTAETVVGLLAAERVATEAARNGATMLVSSGDAVSHLALRGTLRQAYQGAGQAQDYHPNSVQLLAHQDTAAYAAGVAMIYGRQRLEASQLIGSFNQDFLLIGETGAQQGIPQVAGATSTAALPVMLLSSDATLIGEEIFAAEAYISDDAPPQARLRTQDALRIVVIALIVLGFAYNLLLQPLLAPLLEPLLPFPLPPLPEL